MFSHRHSFSSIRMFTQAAGRKAFILSDKKRTALFSSAVLVHSQSRILLLCGKGLTSPADSSAGGRTRSAPAVHLRSDLYPGSHQQLADSTAASDSIGSWPALSE